MINKEIPFRPKLEGEFRVRFYAAASRMVENVRTPEIIGISEKEIQWVENECLFNYEQRKRYRAVWFLFRDLVRASWKAQYRDGILYMIVPTLSATSDNAQKSKEEIKEDNKDRLRGWMSNSRNERLVQHMDFISRMERSGQGREGIASLIADGVELAHRIEEIHLGLRNLDVAVMPYLQLVEKDKKDEYTGLKLSDIWSYFRLTWSTPSETTPGRTMQYLIRDAAHPMHAIMGIASLENCTVQITCRDDEIGWNQGVYIEKLIDAMDEEEVRKHLKELLSYIEDGIEGIDYSDLCTSEEIIEPNEDTIRNLREIADREENNRQKLLKDDVKFPNSANEKSALGSISINAEKALYKRKRAEQLARLLIAKLNILKIYNSKSFCTEWISFCRSEIGNSSIRTALVAQKTKHIGSSMLELNVCGAIPPYNEILGGKLVALLALSPQVIHDYKERYKNKASEIATRLKGEDVCRPSDLVYIGTTSLYYVGSSQYNRLKIPGNLFNSEHDIIWKKLGYTIGFGTLHISKATTESLTEATSDGYSKINHVFGEGASPKMRLLSMSIRTLLEISSDDAVEFSKHAMSRIVYGACLAENTFEYLMGYDFIPKYPFDLNNYGESTQKIIDYWKERWLASRLNYSPIYQRMRNFNKYDFLVSKQINKNNEISYSKFKGMELMPEDDNAAPGVKFIRDFYRGSSAYADHLSYEDLDAFHLQTELDDAIIQDVLDGKDVILTGNPGDGKTHIIRKLEGQLKAIGKPICIVLDASTLSDKEIQEKWEKSKLENKSFIIAINAAVLYSVHEKFPSYGPIDSAYNLMIKSVVFHKDSMINNNELTVYDLSKRDILTPNIIRNAIEKLTDEKYFTKCLKCPIYSDCDARNNKIILNNELFQKRLYTVLQGVSLQGYHATIRELQGFISYLIFGNRTCKKISETNGNNLYNIVNLIYSGKGNLFSAIRKSIDPKLISHPIWDEKLINNQIPENSWIESVKITNEAIHYSNLEIFNLRKRQFYFFNSFGSNLIKIKDDDMTRFSNFIRQEDNKIIKEIIKKLNTFFGAIKTSNNELQVWTGHRYDNEPRKILISIESVKRTTFKIGRPYLQNCMQKGIKMTSNYIRLEKKESPNIFLKIDFEMYVLLTEAERGVPVLFMESTPVKKVWRFIEQLQSSKIDSEISVSVLDIQNKEKLTVCIDIDGEEKKYSSIEVERHKGG